MDYFLCVIGMVMIVEGIPYFAAPKKMKVWMAKIMEMAPASLRQFGLVMMALGLLLVYLGRR
jgi:uncharacterized protein YjeT (DUF2065 family)